MVDRPGQSYGESVTPDDETLSKCRAIAAEAFRTNASAVERLADTVVDESFDTALSLILGAHGRVIVSGIGKSGHIGRKVSATMASLGTPSQFVHSTEAMHGDFGMIVRGDVIILISQSGETEEVVRLVPFLRRNGHPIIALTGASHSRLARHADVVLSTAVEREACPMNLAPTTSTMVALAIGDALAIALGQATGFRPSDFAQRHPGGKLGERLMQSVSSVMKTDDLPVVSPTTLVPELLRVVDAGSLGLALVLAEGRLAGIVTDGDLRRAMREEGLGEESRAADIMTPDPVTISPDSTRFDADERMRERRITALVVVDESRVPLGIVGVHD